MVDKKPRRKFKWPNKNSAGGMKMTINPMKSMVGRQIFPDLTDEEIEYQIELRENLLKEMVGNMYPKVVQQEIDELHDKTWLGKVVQDGN